MLLQGMDPADRPIGVFDSGLGGLTVLSALRERLPGESFVYLGDVARLPYGTKSKNVVLEYARQCADFLQAHAVKAVIVACNTASAMALEGLKNHCKVPVLGVIGPGVRAGRDAASGGRVLVLATESTVRSESYCRHMAALAPEVAVEQVACPLLVPLAEEGWWDHPITIQVIRHYLGAVNWDGVGAVVLGCTHFPLLESSFRKAMPAGISLVHGAGNLAEELAKRLGEAGQLRPGTGLGTLRIFTTDRIHAALPMMGDWPEAVARAEVVHLAASTPA